MDIRETHGAQSQTDGQSKYKGIIPDTAFVDAAQSFAQAWPGKIKVLICEPSIGVIDYLAHEACCDMMFSLARYETESNYKFFKTCLGRLLVQYSREAFAEYAVNMGFDYIFYIDDDHIWESDTFQRLEKWIKDYDIVAPLCVQRAEPYAPVVYKSEFKDIDGQTTFFNRPYVDVKEIKKGDIITDADAIGFGAAIVKTDLFKRVPRPWFMSTMPVGEDITFCAKAKALGKAKILVDTNIEAPHLKNREPVGFADYLKEKERKSHESTTDNAVTK